MTEKQLNHYAIFAFTEDHWQQVKEDRKSFLGQLSEELPQLAEMVFAYSLYPTRPEAELMIWSAMKAEDPSITHQFMARFASTTSGWRQYLKPVNTLWGFTRPSQYTSGKSSQAIDPFSSERAPYLIAYPFVKTSEWYLMSRDVRQGMMNAHIRVGREYPEITQLLLYSTGLQDQEFVVVYETDDLSHFSQLVSALRETEGRQYTLRDTPIYTAVHQPLHALASLWA